MDIFYKTSTKYTYEEYRRFTWSLIKTKTRIVIWTLLEIFLILTGILAKNFFIIGFAILYPFVIILLQNRQIKKYFISNKILKDAEVDFEFYDTYFIQTQQASNSKLDYDKLYKIIETKTNFYLLIGKNQGFILIKENFPDGLCEFMRTIKIK